MSSPGKTYWTDAEPAEAVVDSTEIPYQLEPDAESDYSVFSDPVKKVEVGQKDVLYRKNYWFPFSKVKGNKWEKSVDRSEKGDVKVEELPVEPLARDYVVLGYDRANYEIDDTRATVKPVDRSDEQEIIRVFQRLSDTEGDPTVFFHRPAELLRL